MGIRLKFKLASIFLLFAVNVFAQQDTSTFLLLKVEKGMTLYSISKQFGVSSADILKLNPDLENLGLKIGQTIFIPKQKNTVQKKEIPNYHIVVKGENLFGIAKSYEISLVDLQKLNEKSLEKGLKEGMELRLNDKVFEKIESNIKEENKSINQINIPQFVISEQGTTLYSISKKYGIPADSLIKINEKFLSKGIQPKDTIYLISKESKKTITQISSENTNIKTDSIYLIIGKLLGSNKSEEKINTISEIETSKNIKTDINNSKVNIALLLPFKTKQYKDLINKYLLYGDSAVIRILSNELSDETKISFELLNGITLGLDSTTRNSNKFEIHIFDSQDDSVNINSLKNSTSFRKCNLVVGPIFGNTFNIISNAFPEKLYINPFSRLDNYNFEGKSIIKLTPYNKDLIEITSETIAQKYSSFHKLTIYNENIEELDFIDIVKKHLPENAKNHFAKQSSEALDQKLQQLSINDSLIIYLPTFRQMNVTSLVNKIRPYIKNNYIKLVGFEVWEHFDNLDIEQLNNLNFTYIATEYIDFEAEKTQQFIKNYISRFNNQPSKYAFWGHDISLIIENILLKNKNLNAIKEDGLIKNIHFKNLNNQLKSVENCGYYQITYKDYVRQVSKLVRN
jgi:LysM repeat protein